MRELVVCQQAAACVSQRFRRRKECNRERTKCGDKLYGAREGLAYAIVHPYTHARIHTHIPPLTLFVALYEEKLVYRALGGYRKLTNSLNIL